MKTKFWADLHLDHPNAYKFRPWFKSMKEHDEYMADTLAEAVGPRTVIKLLGDVTVGRKGLETIKKIFSDKQCKSLLVMGNHDAERHGIKARDLIEVYDDIQSLYSQGKGKNAFWLSHAPIHDSELRGKRNIHGHLHQAVIRDERYINVSIDFAKKPVSFEDIVRGEYTTHDKWVNGLTGKVEKLLKAPADEMSPFSYYIK